MTEILAIAKACELCESRSELAGKTVVIMSDSKEAILWINNSGLSNIKHTQIIYDIRCCFHRLRFTSVVFCNRVYNSLTDSLAKKGSSFGGNVLTWSDV